MATKTTHPVALGNWASLRSAPDYRSFLRVYLEGASLSLSDLARATGFHRGFPGDVISGRRRLSPQSHRAFEGALKIPASGKKLFRCLVAREEPDLFPRIESDILEKMIADLRKKSWAPARRELRSNEAPQVSDLFKNPHAVAAYAAAGKPGQGASFQQIQGRTRLAERECEKILRDLERVGLLKYGQGVYEPVDLHLFFRIHGKNDLLTDVFQGACKAAATRIAETPAGEGELFFTSTLCIQESRMPDLKEALRRVILKFADESIHPEGDRIAQLVVGLHL